MDELFSKFSEMDDITEELDYDYSVNEVHIDDYEQFEQRLLKPYRSGKRLIFYRGERISSLKRPLLATMFRERDALMENGENYADVTAEYILRHYRSNGRYIDLFCSTFGQARKYCMYDLCAFSQHYLEWSPFIDFTKSLYVALSFGLKGKHEFENDALMYTVEILDPEKYTQERVTAECWLNDYHVRVYNYDRSDEKMRRVERTSPDAKIIDIATNDRMKFQQGVFLLLDQFNLVNHLYLTKNVRSSVTITKHILSRSVCPALTDLVSQAAPWYSFANLLDVGAGIRTAIESQTDMADFRKTPELR
ncbi:MAG: FRG domain-containing protein [Oscillospiraceae bacterium]|nr:FRG domain-containing protein [Oscillospiraceae bacterium]